MTACSPSPVDTDFLELHFASKMSSQHFSRFTTSTDSAPRFSETMRQHRPALSLDANALGRRTERAPRTARSRSSEQAKTLSNDDTFATIRHNVGAGPLTSVPSGMRKTAMAWHLRDEGTDQSDGFASNASGPLLERTAPGGAVLCLTLDRSIHYRAAGDSMDAGSSTDTSVPRLLLAFTLDIAPCLQDAELGIRENYEFISIHFDFDDVPCATFPDKRPENVPPIVHGFVASSLTATGFLQSFGSELYPPKTSSTPIDAVPAIVLGQTGTAYREFEERLRRQQPPVRMETDRITARGRHDTGSSSIPATPASSRPGTFSQFATSPYFHDTAYGESSIRVMVKRDLRAESSWCARKLAFLILVEPRAAAATVDVKLRLDTCTTRQRLSSITRHDSVDDGWLPKRERKESGGGTASLSASRSTGPGMTGLTDEDERVVRLYPREDPVSVVSRGGGSVRDTLYPSGIMTRARSSITQGSSAERKQSLPKQLSERPAQTESPRTLADVVSSSKSISPPSAQLQRGRPTYARHGHSQSVHVQPFSYLGAGDQTITRSPLEEPLLRAPSTSSSTATSRHNRFGSNSENDGKSDAPFTRDCSLPPSRSTHSRARSMTVRPEFCLASRRSQLTPAVPLDRSAARAQCAQAGVGAGRTRTSTLSSTRS